MRELTEFEIHNAPDWATHYIIDKIPDFASMHSPDGLVVYFANETEFASMLMGFVSKKQKNTMGISHARLIPKQGTIKLTPKLRIVK